MPLKNTCYLAVLQANKHENVFQLWKFSRQSLGIYEQEMLGAWLYILHGNKLSAVLDFMS